MMDPFCWGFVRGGSAALAVGSVPLAVYAAHEGHAGVGTVFALCGFVAAVLWAMNERRRPF